MQSLLMAKRLPPGDTNRTRTVTKKDLENLIGAIAVIHERLMSRAEQMHKAGLNSVRFDGGGMGEDSRLRLTRFVAKLGEAIESEGA
jgi:hypothetical protein